MTIGSRIRQLREDSNLTQEQLAKKVGVTKSAIGNYEQNISSPKESVLYKLIEVLNCDANYIFQDGFEFKSDQINLTIKEQDHVKKYRSLNVDGKEMVDMILNREYQFLEYRKKMENIKNDWYKEDMNDGNK